jgi:hypothetical protein
LPSVERRIARAIVGLLPFDLGQQLFEQEAGVVVAEAVVLVAAVEAIEGLIAEGFHAAMHHEHAVAEPGQTAPALGERPKLSLANHFNPLRGACRFPPYSLTTPEKRPYNSGGTAKL